MDDEPWARARIVSLLKPEPDFEVVRECESGEQAIEAIATLTPDLVFLDVQMPGCNGFEVIEAIGVEAMPLVVFATAFDDYTLQAFEAEALDYLLKPFVEERFRRTLARVRKTSLRSGSQQASLRQLLDSASRERRYLQRLAVGARGELKFVSTAAVSWLEAAGNYVTVHAGRESYLLRDTLEGLGAKLDPDQFMRLHRSAIVNVDCIERIAPWARGEQIVVLRDGTQLTIGRRYRARVEALIRNVV